MRPRRREPAPRSPPPRPSGRGLARVEVLHAAHVAAGRLLDLLGGATRRLLELLDVAGHDLGMGLDELRGRLEALAVEREGVLAQLLHGRAGRGHRHGADRLHRRRLHLREGRLALLVLLAAVALAVAAYPLRARWWGGLVLAIAEAGIVGGLADWFAVTALFRHPLGLPIPHTAIIPANWELMAQRVGTMVGDRVLTKEYVTQEIARFDIADLLARGAERMRPADLEAVGRAIASRAAG